MEANFWDIEFDEIEGFENEDEESAAGDKEIENDDYELLKGGWKVQVSNCHRYLYALRNGYLGVISIKGEDEGYAVDIYDDSDEASVLDSATGFYSDLEV